MPGSGREPAPKARVLVVDDDPLVLRSLSDLLSTAGFAVVGAATSGAEGVAMAFELRPDVVLMDLRMPGMDGTVAAKAITSELPEIPVLVLTAYDDEVLRSAAEDAGVYCYLVKDSSHALILQMIEQAKAWHDGLMASREEP